MSSTGPSKNELKKLAKKAEKAAKKAAAKGGAGQAPASAADKATATIPKAPELLLANPSENSAATLKVVWTSQLYKVDLKVAGAADIKKCSGQALFQKQTALVYGDDQWVSGGGNAMAQTVAGVSDNVKHSFADKMMVDEWCEWERTVLRPAASNSKKLQAALQHLEAALSGQHSAGVHLVGHHDTVADVCVLVTLSQVSEGLPDHVQKYLSAHENALHAARQAVTELPSSSTIDIDMNEPSLLKVLDQIFRETVTGMFGDVVTLPANIVSKSQNPKQGDFQCNAAMPTAAALKKSGNSDFKSPQQVAAAIVDAVDHPVVTELQVSGPGFVLFRIQAAFLEHHVNAFIKTGKLPLPRIAAKQTCVVDFSSPNIAKEMHVGHLRSTIIGESVCRILESVGHTVHRVNHVGDWGTQFGMLIQYLKEEYPEVGKQGAHDLPNITDLTVFYKNAKKRFDDSPEFKKTSQTNVVKLQSGDPECLQIWKMLCDLSRGEFEKVYKRLDVTLTECGESFYNKKIPAVIEEFEKAGKISVEEGGAKCVFIEGFKVPLMLQKSDGGFGYDSTDMAALKYRLQDLKADRIIVITDFSQGDHFKMVYAAGRDIGWLKGGQRLDHIGFGTVMGEDGKRIKSRSGDTVRLVDLLDEAVSRMEASLKERIDKGIRANITIDELHPVAEAIGYGAVKYYDLRRNPTSNYKFSYDQMLDTKGDTAVYLLYARVRLESICAKAKAEHNVDVEALLQAGEQIELGHPSERNLAVHLQCFADSMEQTLDDLYPSHICEYVYKLAIAASDFVTQCKVLGSPEMKSRLLLCHATTVAMHQCFDLLGIRHVKRI